MTPRMEEAWRRDEGIRFTENTLRQIRNAGWRQRILDIEEWGLFDYERPLKVMPATKKKPLKERIIQTLRLLIP